MSQIRCPSINDSVIDTQSCSLARSRKQRGAVQDRLLHLEAWDTHLLGGMLLWLENMCRPILRRLTRLHSMFSRPMRDVFEMVSRIDWDQREAARAQAAAAASSDPKKAESDLKKGAAEGGEDAAPIAQAASAAEKLPPVPISLASAGITKAIVDSLHDMLLETECLGSRYALLAKYCWVLLL